MDDPWHPPGLVDGPDAKEGVGRLLVVVELTRPMEDGADGGLTPGDAIGVVVDEVFHRRRATMGGLLSLQRQEDDDRRNEGQGAGVAAEEGHPVADESREGTGIGPAVLEIFDRVVRIAGIAASAVARCSGGGAVGGVLDGLVLRLFAGPIRNKCRQFVHDLKLEIFYD